MNGDSESAPETPKKKIKEVRRYKQKYLTKWENDPNYKDWVSKSKKGVYFFYCKACDTDCKCGISELQRHKRGKKHQSRIKSSQNNGLYCIYEEEVINENVMTESQKLEGSFNLLICSLKRRRKKKKGFNQASKNFCRFFFFLQRILKVSSGNTAICNSTSIVNSHRLVKLSRLCKFLFMTGIMLAPDTNIGFLGAGRMAQALAGGFIKAELITADRMWASSPPEDQIFLDQTKLLGLNVTYDNREVVEKCDVIIIAVKPHIVDPVLKEVADLVKADHLFISIAAGITISAIEKGLPEKTRVVRIMPNTPALVGCSASVFAEGHSVHHEDANITSLLFSSIGVCERGTESMLDAVTGLSGSGPAYIFLVIEALADGGVKMGLSRPLAQKLAAQTVMGTAKMVLETQMHPGELKDNVCSPGGTTIYGVHKLEICGVRAAFISAVEAATCRSKELGKE